MELLNAVVGLMRDSWLGVAGRDIYWVFPAAEIVHFFGLCLFMGAILIVDLRILGFASRLSLQAVLKLVPLSLVGLALNLLSGIVFLCAYPENYWPSFAFRLKLLAILLGLANAVWFKKKEAPRLESLPETAIPDSRTRLVAVLSLCIWIFVIGVGRFLPFVSVSTS